MTQKKKRSDERFFLFSLSQEALEDAVLGLLLGQTQGLQLQNLIAENKVGDKVELSGTFCIGRCQQGVCVLVDEAVFSVNPDTVDEFFKKEVLPKV